MKVEVSTFLDELELHRAICVPATQDNMKREAEIHSSCL